MFYEAFTAERFFTKITTESEARALLRRSRFQGTELQCPSCQAGAFYAIRTRPEVRTCRECHRQVRLRVGTIFEASKTSLLLWVKAVFYVMQGKRGMSAQELQRHLGVKSYGRVRGHASKDSHSLASSGCELSSGRGRAGVGCRDVWRSCEGESMRGAGGH